MIILEVGTPTHPSQDAYIYLPVGSVLEYI